MATKKKFGEFEKLGKGVSPRGITSWAFLENPQEDDKGREQFRITLFMDPDTDEAKEFQNKIKEWRKEGGKKFGKPVGDMQIALKKAEADVIERAGLEDRVKPGWLQMEFNSTRRREDDTMAIVDASKQPCGEPWKGDISRVQFNAVAYRSGGNFGVKLYLSGVQVLERLSSGGGSGTDLFDEEEIEFDESAGEEGSADDDLEAEGEEDELDF